MSDDRAARRSRAIERAAAKRDGPRPRADAARSRPGRAAPRAMLKVFVLGPARSGTSITHSCLRKIFRLPGRGESHMMPAFQAMLAAFDDYRRKKKTPGNIAFKSIEPAEVEAGVQDMIRGFYTGMFPGGAFVDKTPGPAAIRGIPLIQATFPDAKIVLTKRGGLETVNSYAKKFNSNLAAACKIWNACMEATLWAQDNCSGILIIEQFDMTNQPEEVARQLCEYLGTPAAANEVGEFLRQNEQQKSSSHDASKPLTLADLPWTAEDKEIFRRLCGDTMQRLGYPM